MKKIIALLCIVSMLVCCLASCGGGNETVGGNTDAPARDVEDGLPDTLDFGNKTVTVLTETGIEALSFKRDSLTNDVLNDAIYNREYKVNSRCGVKLNFLSVDDPEDKAETSILTGLDEYQIVAISAADLFGLAAGSNLLDFNSGAMQYIDLDREWFNQYLREKGAIYGKLYCVTGSLALSTIQKCSATAFNPIVLDQLGITENLYDVVRAGQWTIDKQLDLIKKAYSDTTGDGKTQDDSFGLCFDNSSAVDYYWSAFDLSLLDRTSDGGLETTSNTSKFVSAIEKVYSIMYENQNVNCFNMAEYDNGGGGDYVTSLLAEDRSLFITINLRNCELETMRNMKAEYGILPMPKWDEEQADYYSCLRDGWVAFGIPKTNTDLDVTSAVFTSLSAYSYAYVQPAYYDKILKGRYMNDPDSQKMLDIITTNINMDEALLHGYALDKMSTELFRSILQAGKKNFQSIWKSGQKKYTKALNDLMAQYAKNED